ncbi:hypothetical protein DPMN_076525 [Dreissena polymorpha]|uniref:Uncharacterized protein n=1 Tax=Dreissena polymorpha TaxID=45954 RepID=A0A9D4BNQ8_DREPO|nr:hypothetical protein DPMN_076525 [Dreissena polymorpha]
MGMSSVPPLASIQYQRWPFLVLEVEGDQENRGLTVLRLVHTCGMGDTDPQNRGAWKSGFRRYSRLLPTPTTGTNPAADDK